MHPLVHVVGGAAYEAVGLGDVDVEQGVFDFGVVDAGDLGDDGLAALGEEGEVFPDGGIILAVLEDGLEGLFNVVAGFSCWEGGHFVGGIFEVLADFFDGGFHFGEGRFGPFDEEEAPADEGDGEDGPDPADAPCVDLAGGGDEDEADDEDQGQGQDGELPALEAQHGGEEWGALAV